MRRIWRICLYRRSNEREVSYDAYFHEMGDEQADRAMPRPCACGITGELCSSTSLMEVRSNVPRLLRAGRSGVAEPNELSWESEEVLRSELKEAGQGTETASPSQPNTIELLPPGGGRTHLDAGRTVSSRGQTARAGASKGLTEAVDVSEGQF